MIILIIRESKSGMMTELECTCDVKDNGTARTAQAKDEKPLQNNR